MTEPRDIDHLIKLASDNIESGIIEEPRFFFDQIRLTAPVSKNDPGAFINREDFPVRLTHVLFGLRTTQQGTPDERILQKCGVRFVFHDSYYQSRQFAPVPLWQTQVTTGPAALATSFMHHTFDRPVILSARDSLAVTVALEQPPATQQTRRASVGFHGVGLESKRPYFLHAYRDLGDLVAVTLPSADFRNDGTEPIALTDMVAELAASTDDFVGAGDIRALRIRVRQLGNGTGRDWTNQPTNQTTGLPIEQMPGHLWGTTEGRALVHRLPGQGLIWEPGEGITVEATALGAAATNANLLVAVAGYISLT